jgi:hypothetical protein
MSYTPAQTIVQYVAPPFTPTNPTLTSFSWVNQGSASVAAASASVTLIAPGVAGANLRIRDKAVPTAPYTVTAVILPLMFRKQWYSAGLCLRDSASGKVEVYDQQCDTGERRLRVSQYTNPTTILGNVFANSVATMLQFWRINDDNTNRIISISGDGINWQTIYSVSRTDWLTPNRIGWFVNPEVAAGTLYEIHAQLLSWAEA